MNDFTRQIVKWTMLVGLIACLFGLVESALGYTANKVWFEFKPRGGFRVYVNYTVPEIKEFREAYVEFTDRREAEKFYWDIVRGADFYPGNPQSRRFVNSPLKPVPW